MPHKILNKLVFYEACYYICFMRSKLFKEKPKRMETASGRWLQIVPENDNVYHLYDALTGDFIGRILFDADGNWIYDGDFLSIMEQEDVAGSINGHQKEMDNWLSTL